MKSKSGKKLKPLQTVIIVSACVLAVCATFLTVRLIQTVGKEEVTPEYLSEMSTKAMGEYEYSVLILDTQQTIGEESTVEEYMLTTSKNDSYRTYIYRNETDDLYQCWRLDENTGLYTVYIYDSMFETWVQTSLEYEPLSSNTWLVTSDLTNYSVLPETDMWGEDECYVVQVTGSSDELAVIYEEIYIRCNDYLPMGIISYGISDLEKDRVSDIDPAEFGKLNGYNVDDATVETSEFLEIISVYTLEFSNESLELFGLPEEFITDVEYMSLLESEEVKDGETDN